MKYEEMSVYVVNEVTDTVYISDLEDYSLYYLNKSALNLLGNPEEHEWRGKKCYKLLQGKDSPCEFCTNNILSLDKFYEWEYYNPIFNKYYSLKDKLIKLGEKDVRLEIATDVTTKLLLQQDLKRRLDEQKTLNECVEALHSNVPANDAMNNLLDLVLEYYKANRAYIFEISKTGEFIDNTYERCKEGITSEIDTLVNIPIENGKLWFEKFETVGEFYIDSVSEQLDPNSHEYEILNRQNISSIICAPLYDFQNIAMGFVGVDDPQINIANTNLIHLVSKSISDFIEKDRLFNKLRDLSFIDNMTGLKNRHSYNLKLAEFEISEPPTLGVAYIDINGMKEINDTKGHRFGDGVIVSLAKMLDEIFSEQGYRVSGDEFIVLCENIEENDFEEKISVLKGKINGEKYLKASIGYSWSVQGDGVSKQVELADSLMYMEKQQAHGYDIQNKYTTMLSQNLEREIAENRYVVFLQPQINLQSGKIASAEALIRRLDSSGQIQPPLTFVPFYEKEGIISKIDIFVFEEICKVLKKWNENGKKCNIKLAANFSRITVAEKGIIETLCKICEKHSVSPSSIIIEITEAIGLIDTTLLSEIIRGFSKAGFSLSLDDFGSGQSNLAIMTTSDFDEVKIDMSLVKELASNEKSRIITKLAIDICNELNDLDSVAEGIETKEQCEILKQMNCKKGQGYYFDKPLPIEQFEEKYI